MKISLSRLSMFALLASTAVACATTTDTEEGQAGDEEALTTLTARSRKLTFAGYVYLDPSATDATIKSAIKNQTQSAFGALRTASVGVNTRELHDVDKTTFLKTNVDVVDPAHPTAAPLKMMKVAYTYTDDALVPISRANRSALSLGLLSPGYQSQVARILSECTANDSEAKEFQGSLWYVFNPSLSSCKQAMTVEQKNIDADRAGLTKTQVSLSEVQRLYTPLTVNLQAKDTNSAISYPEYDRLYAGGVEPGKLVIGMVNGMMADWAAGEHHDTFEDSGYDMWMQGLREIIKSRPNMKFVSLEGNSDPFNYSVGASHATFASFQEILAFELDNKNPAGVTSANRNAFRKAVADTIAKKFVTFEAPVTVTTNGVAKPVTIKLQSYFGAETDPTPHKRAIKTSDVFLYNGHAYIGYGPLDPSNFSSADFPSSYQIMFVNACVSYNYYEKDYIPLKSGGTKNLDLVTNGLESWVNESGPAMGRFIGNLIDGKQHSYQELLKAAQFTYYGYDWGMDALRVVDGELDNKWKPTKTPMTVVPR